MSKQVFAIIETTLERVAMVDSEGKAKSIELKRKVKIKAPFCFKISAVDDGYERILISAEMFSHDLPEIASLIEDSLLS